MTIKTAGNRRIHCASSYIICSVLMLGGCAGVPRTTAINVPVPVRCTETMPVRPVMPTEALRPGGALDTFVKSAIAEIERREAYELELVGALVACKGS
jgi:hypothetical protein